MTVDRPRVSSTLITGVWVCALAGCWLTVPTLPARARDMIACEQAFISVVEGVRPSVVTVIAYSDLPVGHEAREGKSLELKKSVGSGVVLNSEGHVVTALGVVGESRNLFIRTSAGDERPAVFLGADYQSQLALLKTKPDGLKPVLIGQPDELEPGAWAIIVAESFGDFPRYAFGAFTTVSSSGVGSGTPGMLEMSAQVYPGYTGGAVANADGEVVGVVLGAMSGLVDPNRPQVSLRPPIGPALSLAIPIDMAGRVAEQLAKHGKVATGYLGVRVRTPAPALKDLLKFEDGVLIDDVVPGSPADAAGIEAGDVILTFAGKPVRNQFEFVRLVGSMRPSTRCMAELLRGDERLSREVTLSSWPTSELNQRLADQERRQIQRRIEELRERIRILEGQLESAGGS